MEAMFLRHGRKFYNIVAHGSTYLQYEGPRLHYEIVGNCYVLQKQKADGRVVVDLLSFARMKPGYPRRLHLPLLRPSWNWQNPNRGVHRRETPPPVSVFELGVTPQDLETKLMEILEIASQWRPVLLLDEADLYLEKRTANADPNRIAMTAIFLRLPEYYRSVLFLTTNRVASFDDSFCSRISMFLRYHRLSGAQREAVWSNLLARAQIQNPDLTLFRKSELNGREIRNCIRIAQSWARSLEKKLTTEHVVKVMNMLGDVRRDLEGAIMEETDERSFTRAAAKVHSKLWGR